MRKTISQAKSYNPKPIFLRFRRVFFEQTDAKRPMEEGGRASFQTLATWELYI